MIRRGLKRAVLGLSVCMVALTAMPALPAVTKAPVEVEAAVEPRADVIRWMYRELEDGTIQKRRWNATKGYWVDPYWINVT